MRPAALALAVSMLALAACGEKESTGNTAAVDEALTARDFATNDATAIDAATGADANMAADVDINFGSNAGDGVGNAASSRPTSRERRPSGATNTTNASEPATPAPAPTTPPAETNSD